MHTTKVSLLVNISYASLTLSIIFSCYLATSSLAVLSYGDWGYDSYAIIYIFNIFGSLCAPYIVSKFLGVKWTIFLGALTYLAYNIAYGLDSGTILLIVSGINGFGAGLFRSQQNTWITSLVNDAKYSIPFYVSIYFTIFSASSIIGFGFSSLLLFYEFKIDTVEWILVGISVISLFLFSFSKDVELKVDHNASLSEYLEIFKNSDFILLYPLIFYQSLAMVFSYGVLPKLYKNETYATYGFLCYGLGVTISTYCIGIIFKRVKIERIVYFSLLVTISLVGITLLTTKYELLLYLSSILSGCNESLINFCIICILSNFEYKLIYGYHRAWYCAFSAISMFLVTYISVLRFSILIIITNFLSLVCYTFYLRYRTQSNLPV